MDNRFEVVKEEQVGGTFDVIYIKILRDKQTGVMYMYSRYGGLTPLLDKDGKPMTTFKVNI